MTEALLGSGQRHRSTHDGIALASRVTQRVAVAGLTLVASSGIIWFLSALAPGDPAQRVLATRGVRSPTSEQLADVTSELGLDEPSVVRYAKWVWGLLQGDMSHSYISGRSVSMEIQERLPPTLILAGTAFVMMICFALVAGMASAALAGRWPDYGVRLLTIVCAAVPSFVTGLVLIQVVVVRWGYGSALASGGFEDVLLPAACIALSGIAVPTRVLRGSLVDALQQHYSLVSRARGARRSHVLIRHALPNALVPFVHAMAMAAAWMIAGAVIVEAVFNWPGIGSFLVQAVQQRDLPVIQGVALLATACYIAASLAADLISTLLDPQRGVRS